jgi:hypothetical protein
MGKNILTKGKKRLIRILTFQLLLCQVYENYSTNTRSRNVQLQKKCISVFDSQARKLVFNPAQHGNCTERKFWGDSPKVAGASPNVLGASPKS